MSKSKSGGGGGGKDYEVGYGKPPRGTRFTKGKSGNPYGRPRKSDCISFKESVNPVRDVVLEEMARRVSLKEGGSEIELEAFRAVIRAATVGAIRGNSRQQKLVLDFATAAQEARSAELKELVQSVEVYEARWEEVFEDARSRDRAEPAQLPHPDHVNVDPLTLEFVVTGPIDKKDKKAWDFLKWQLRETERRLWDARTDAAAHPRSRHKSEIVQLTEEHVRRLEEKVLPGWDWREQLGWEEAYSKRVYARLNLPPPEPS